MEIDEESFPGFVKIVRHIYHDFSALDWKSYKNNGILAHNGQLPLFLTKHYQPDMDESGWNFKNDIRPNVPPSAQHYKI
jgi:hypothetical protein